MQIMSISAKEAQSLLTKNQNLVLFYKEVLEKVAGALGNNKNAIQSCLAKGSAIRAEVQDNRIESSIVNTLSANVVLQENEPGTSILSQPANQDLGYNKFTDQDMGNSGESLRRSNRSSKRPTIIKINFPAKKTMRIENQRSTGKNNKSEKEMTSHIALQDPGETSPTRSTKQFKDNGENMKAIESKDSNSLKILANTRKEIAEKLPQPGIHSQISGADLKAKCISPAIGELKNSGSKPKVFPQKHRIKIKYVNYETIEEMHDLPRVHANEMKSK